MNCPNCSFDFGGQNLCPNCGIDVVLFKKTSKTSNALYNKALEQIKIKDLSGAIESLTRSIEFNKVNHHSRNLLGLVYFEVGMVGESLKQWIISQNFVKEDNLAGTYIEKIRANSRELEKMNDSIKMYNQALAFMLQKNDDMAAIQLKKALDCNPKFLQAHNLLALRYIAEDNQEKALQSIEKVLSIDSNNAIAVSYFNKLNPNKGKHDIVEKIVIKKEKVAINDSSYSQIHGKRKKSFADKFHLSEIFTFLLGALCTFVLFQVLLIPDYTNRHKDEVLVIESELAKTKASYEAEIAQKEEELLTLRKEKEAAEKANAELLEGIDLDSRIKKLDEVTAYITEGSYEEAVALLDSINTSDFPTEAIQKFSDVKLNLYPILEQDYYSKALRDYNSRNYSEAKEVFEKSLKYSTEASQIIDDSHYFLGRIAEMDGDVEAAKKYYEYIINDFTSSNQLNSAKSRYRNL